MDLLFGDASGGGRQQEELVLELLNCAFFLFSQMAGKWIRQTPGDLNRILVFRKAR